MLITGWHRELLTHPAAGFLFAVDSARGRILFVSSSVADTLHFVPAELTGQSLFDILHPRDRYVSDC